MGRLREGARITEQIYLRTAARNSQAICKSAGGPFFDLLRIRLCGLRVFPQSTLGLLVSSHQEARNKLLKSKKRIETGPRRQRNAEPRHKIGSHFKTDERRKSQIIVFSGPGRLSVPAIFHQSGWNRDLPLFARRLFRPSGMDCSASIYTFHPSNFRSRSNRSIREICSARGTSNEVRR